MDILVGTLVVGCALAGGFWGAVRLAAWVTAPIVAVLAARWAGPAAAALVSGGKDPTLWATAGGMVLTGAVAAAVVLVAGRGLRQGLARGCLGWADRVGGALVAGTAAVLVTAVLLALAGANGYSPVSPWSHRLQQLGRDLLIISQGQADAVQRL